MSQYKYLLRFGALAFLLWVSAMNGWMSIVGLENAHAQELITSSVISVISTVVGFLISFLNFLMWLIFQLLTLVLDPYIIFDLGNNGEEGGLVKMLHSLWRLSRDLMNVIFALLLIVGAIVAIVTAKMDMIKEKAPKFVMAVVFVNFSWFVPRVIFDFSQIAAYTVYQIPSIVGELERCQVTVGAPPNERQKECEIVVEVLFLQDTEEIGKIKPDADGVRINPDDGSTWHCPMEGIVCYEYAPLRTANAAPDMQIINGLIVNHARMQSLADLVAPSQGELDAVRGRFDIGLTLSYLIKMLLALLLHIALFFPLLAMTVAFFIRIPVLWITMAFMPFVFLEFVMGSLPGGFSPTEKLWKGFLTACFLPVLVAVPLTVGFILINVGSNLAPPAIFTEGNQLIPILQDVRSLWQLMWMFIAIYVLWTQVFAILESAEYSKGITSTIKSMGESAGKLALKAPLAMPIVPVGTGGAGGAASPLELMRQMDPRTMLRGIDATGRMPSAASRAAAPVPADITRARDGIDVATITNNVNTQIDNIVRENAPRSAAGQQNINTNLQHILTELRRIHANELRGLSDDAVIAGLIDKMPDQNQQRDFRRKVNEVRQVNNQPAL